MVSSPHSLGQCVRTCPTVFMMEKFGWACHDNAGVSSVNCCIQWQVRDSRWVSGSLELLRNCHCSDVRTSALEVSFWAYRVRQDPSDSKINPTGYMLDIFPFCSIHLRYILQIPLKWSVMLLLKSWTSHSYFSNLTSSSATKLTASSSQTYIGPYT